MLISSNAGLLKENHKLKTQFSLLDAQIAEINVTYKTHETKVSELDLDSAATNYSLKLLDTRLKTIEGKSRKFVETRRRRTLMFECTLLRYC